MVENCKQEINFNNNCKIREIKEEEKNDFPINCDPKLDELTFKQFQNESKKHNTQSFNFNLSKIIDKEEDEQHHYYNKNNLRSNSLLHFNTDVILEQKENCFKNDYIDEDCIIGENIIINDQNIVYISTDLLLKKIAMNELNDFSFDIVKYLSIQLNCILSIDQLIYKLESFYNTYVYKLHSDENKFPLGIMKLLNHWIINEYPDHITKVHFSKLKEFYIKILKFLKNSSENSLYQQTEKVNKYIEDKLLFSEGVYNRINKPSSVYKNKKKYSLSTEKMCEPILPSSHTLFFDILEWSEVEIARQLSLISCHLINRIKVSEFYLARFTKGEKFTNSPHIMKCIDRFNKLSLWITEEVLSYDKARYRAMVLEKFILVAKECANMSNFNDCFNIITSLNTFPIKRLNKSWRMIKNFEIMNTFIELNQLCSLSKNFVKLRTEIQKVFHKPSVPYLGIYLKELAFLEEGPKYFKDRLIYLDKIKKFGEIYQELSKNKTFKYEFKPVFMLSFLADPQPDTEDNLIELSYKLEPTFTLSHTKQVKKRLTTTDKNSLDMTKTFNKIVKETFNDTITNKMNLKDAIKNFLQKK